MVKQTTKNDARKVCNISTKMQILTIRERFSVILDSIQIIINCCYRSMLFYGCQDFYLNISAYNLWTGYCEPIKSIISYELVGHK